MPFVALVGKPNVGKSTLFNRLAGQRLAIVQDVPGVTRDRHYTDAVALGREYVLIDTGGFDPESPDPMMASISNQVALALDECDVVVCVLDATSEPTGADREAIRRLRQSGKPTLYVANKADSPTRQLEALGLYELGVPDLLPVSALHGHGTGDLEEAIGKALPPEEPETALTSDERIPRVAIIGRPNAGKSSLVNRLLGQERVLVDARPGTTVDSIDSVLHRRGRELLLIDTAGMRRKRAVHGGVEGLGVLRSIRSIARSHVAVLLIDGAAGPVEQDAKIAGLAVERGRGLVVGLNKTDQMGRTERTQTARRTREILAFAPWAPIVPLSVRTGRGVGALMRETERALRGHNRRVTTGELNRFFEEVIEHHPPPAPRKRPVRIHYVTQAEVRPPTFVLMVNHPEDIHFSYQRYVANQIRERFGFGGTPIRIRCRHKSKSR